MYLRSFIITVAVVTIGLTTHAQQPSVVKVKSELTYLQPAEVSVRGLIGDAIASNRKGRIASLPVWNNGELITMFSKEVKNNHEKMDWYGEHGGKFLYMASHAAKHSGDKELEALVIKTADYLVKQQDDDGYLGNYGPKTRLTNDAISHKRSWDVWNLSYMTLGLLQMNKYYPKAEYLNAAKSIGELFIRMYGDEKHNITDYGTRRGVSATVALDPVVELYKVTGDQRYLDLAGVFVKQFEKKEDHRLITAGKTNLDMEFVGDGKIYQIIWNLTGVAKLYEVTGNVEYKTAIDNIWQNIVDYHLNITGGPWGGVGKHMECFNRKNYWSPYGLVETCSTMSWIQLNKELLRLTGDAKYAQEIEKSAYNSLLGARFANGVDWSYHSFNNGTWSVANFNDCCPSSGAMALEELPDLIYSKKANGVSVNFYTDSEANILLNTKNPIRITQKTAYPFDGKIQLSVMAKNETFPLSIRIPEWANSASVKVNGKSIDASALKKGDFFTINRAWNAKDIVEIEFPFDVRVVQMSEHLDGPQDAAEIHNVKWFALMRGPLVFAASGLIDGKDRERTVDVDVNTLTDKLAPATMNGANGERHPAFELRAEGIQQPLLFVPYYEAGGAKKGGWRLTWLQAQVH